MAYDATMTMGKPSGRHVALREFGFLVLRYRADGRWCDGEEVDVGRADPRTVAASSRLSRGALASTLCDVRTIAVLVLSAALGGGVTAQASMPTGIPFNAIQNTPYNPNVNPHTGTIFEPVAVFPRPSDLVGSGGAVPLPPVPPMLPSLLRCSGLFGFSDTDPVSGLVREYCISGRSDGLMLMDCTPQAPVGGVSFTAVVMPTTNVLSWVGEPGPESWSVAQPAAYALLNGVVHGNTHDDSLMSAPGVAWPFDYQSTHTPNREVTVWHDESVDRWWAFSVSAYRRGLWVVPLHRVGGVLQFQNAGTWLGTNPVPGPPSPMPWLGNGHTVYLDAANERLFITDDSNHATVAVQLLPGGAAPAAVVDVTGPAWSYSPEAWAWKGVWVWGHMGAHDAMPVGDYLYITFSGEFSEWTSQATPPPNGNDWGCGMVDIVSLKDLSFQARLSCGPTNRIVAPPGLFQPRHYQWPTMAGTHSVYVDGTSTPEASLWVVQEDADPLLSSPPTPSRVAGMRFAYSSPDEVIKFREAIRTVLPDGYATLPSHVPSRIHYLRGIGRLGFVAHYHDGLSLLDLSDVHDRSGGTPANPQAWFSDSFSVLGSFDSSYETMPLSGQYESARFAPSGWGPPNSVQGFVDGFLGCWDVYPQQDSGLVYASCGESGVAVFRVRQCQINRFGSGTPFSSLSSNAGLAPRVEVMSGPAREGRSVVLHDGNRDKYRSATLPPGSLPTKYRYKYRYSVVDQNVLNVSFAPFSQSASQPAPDPANGYMYVTNQVLETPWSDSDILITPLGARDQLVIGQLLVQEYRFAGNPAQWQATGYWAASRGTWFRVGKP